MKQSLKKSLHNLRAIFKVCFFTFFVGALLPLPTTAQTVTQSWATLASASFPFGLVIDASDNVYTTNAGKSTISQVTPSGTLTQSWATLAAAPYGIDIDGSGNIYTANYSNSTISKITPSALPIELLDFSGRNTEGGNLLTWTTANEQNNKGFQVEKLNSLGNWDNIGFKAANNKSYTYEFTDNTPLSISYYRLRQIDYDGKETLSKVISVNTKSSANKNIPLSNE